MYWLSLVFAVWCVRWGVTGALWCTKWPSPIQTGAALATSIRCALQWRHNGRDGVSNHRPHDCLLKRLFRRRSKKTSKLRVAGLCAGNSPETGEFPTQMASNAEKVSIWWSHRGAGNHWQPHSPHQRMWQPQEIRYAGYLSKEHHYAILCNCFFSANLQITHVCYPSMLQAYFVNCICSLWRVITRNYAWIYTCAAFSLGNVKT